MLFPFNNISSRIFNIWHKLHIFLNWIIIFVLSFQATLILFKQNIFHIFFNWIFFVIYLSYNLTPNHNLTRKSPARGNIDLFSTPMFFTEIFFILPLFRVAKFLLILDLSQFKLFHMLIQNIILTDSVYLVGGKSLYEGNVYATNSKTGISGPICDDAWNLNSVSIIQNM